MGAHNIRDMSHATAAGPAAAARLARSLPAPLTKRRSVDFCRVATALCPGPRQG